MIYKMVAMGMLISVPAVAQSYDVQGWHTCRHFKGPGIIWYNPCEISSTYEAVSCEAAYDRLSSNDCCSRSGGHSISFKKINCMRKS